MRFSIRMKLAVGFAALVLLTGVIAAVAIGRLSRLVSVSHSLIEEEIPEIHVLRESVRRLSIMEWDLERLILDKGQQELLALSEREKSIRELMMSYGRFHPNPPQDMDEGLREFVPRYRALQNTTADIVSLVQQGAQVKARALLLGTWKEYQRGVLESLNLLMNHEDRATRQTADLIQAASRSTRNLIIQLAVGGIILSCALAFWITSSVTRPIANLIEVTNRVAGGALNLQAKIWREDEIGTLARRFNEMVNRLNESFEGQRRLYDDASHELRTPLTAIRGVAEVALRGPEKSLDEYIEALKSVVALASEMGQLVDDLLFLARAGAGQLQYEMAEVPLAPLLEEVIDQSRGLTSLIDLHLELEVETTERILIWGDPRRLHQLFLTLMDNAIKYTNPGGKVTVTLRPEPHWARVLVSDTGIGISEKDIPQIFERFYMADASRARSEKSTGLGLSIAQSIVKAHKGDILVESAVGRGTTFSVLLPRVSSQG
jgi:signal transduction histidine kinase